MKRIVGFELFAVDLPFRVSFKHAAAARKVSDSLFLCCHLDDGTYGWGESLPRDYVTGESRDAAFDTLATRVLPGLLERTFEDLAAVEGFLANCDGGAPAELLDPSVPQTATWCAVDLALLDAFGRSSGQPVLAAEPRTFPQGLRYSGVLSAETGWKKLLLLLAHRWMGFRAIKLKLGKDSGGKELRTIRRLLGAAVDLRADVNMGWSVDEALQRMPELAEYGIRSFEQPIPAADLEGMARLIEETGLGVMADESFSTRRSLEQIVSRQAATAINARISKCGGLVATLARCRQARAADMTVQVGCQVGESSLLSAAHLRLVAAVAEVRYAEGCFGTLLLEEDPGRPVRQFSRGGRPPTMPQGPGLGVEIDRALIERHSPRRIRLGEERT